MKSTKTTCNTAKGDNTMTQKELDQRVLSTMEEEWKKEKNGKLNAFDKVAMKATFGIAKLISHSQEKKETKNEVDNA